MTIIQKDIERYQGYLEFAQDGLFRCHPKDEPHFQQVIFAYSEILADLEKLQDLLNKKRIKQCET